MTESIQRGAVRRLRVVYIVTASIVVALVAGIMLLFYRELTPEQREVAHQLLPKIAAYGAAVFVACLVLFGNMLGHLFKGYVTPVMRLADETRLIAVAGAKYRIPLAGAPEVMHLTEAINDLADKHIALKTDVQGIVQASRAEVQGEKQRLEALMVQMPDGVVVCNLDGRILLYNHSAQAIVERRHLDGGDGPSTVGLLGMGRSIFGILGRHPVIHALNALQKRLDRDDSRAPFTFVAARGGDQFLRVRMSPIVTPQTSRIEGYVMMIADITDRIQADSRRDMFLQSLTISLQMELNRIRESAAALLGLPERTANVADHGGAIDQASTTLLERIDQVAVQHATRLQEPADAEFILGQDLIDMLREIVAADFGIHCTMRIDSDVWLNMNSYTVVRGVVYLLGQLTKNVKVEKVELHLAQLADAPHLVVRWTGDPVTLRMVEQWKECPLMLGGTGRGTVSLTTLLAGRGDFATGSNGDTDQVASVRFRLEKATQEAPWVADVAPDARPVYYDFDLFESTPRRADYDHVALSDLTYVVLDTETTGLDPSGGDEIVSLGGVRIVRGRLRREEVFDQLVDPRRGIPLESLRIHHIAPEMLRGMPLISQVLAQFHRFAEGSVLVGHNVAFDMRFVHLKEAAAGVVFDHPVLDTLHLSAIAYPTDEPHNLDEIASRLGIPVVGRHTALGDALLTAEVLLKLIPLLEEKGIRTLAEARAASRNTPYSKIQF